MIWKSYLSKNKYHIAFVLMPTFHVFVFFTFSCRKGGSPLSIKPHLCNGGWSQLFGYLWVCVFLTYYEYCFKPNQSKQNSAFKDMTSQFLHSELSIILHWILRYLVKEKFCSPLGFEKMEIIVGFGCFGPIGTSAFWLLYGRSVITRWNYWLLYSTSDDVISGSHCNWICIDMKWKVINCRDCVL